VMHAVQRGGNVVDGWEREIVLSARWAARKWQSRHGGQSRLSLGIFSCFGFRSLDVSVF
jgi:hypothetical protein